MEIRVGICGLGWAGGAHVTSYNEIEGVEVVAAFDKRPLDSAELSAIHGSSITVYNTLEEMCERPDIDLISVCSPHPFHPEQVETVASAGKHVVIEKPVAINHEGLERVETAVKKSGKKAMVCFEVKVIGLFRTLRDLLDQGLLGELHYGECDYFHGIGPWYGQYE